MIFKQKYEIRISNYYFLEYIESNKKMLLVIDLRDTIIYLNTDLINKWDPPHNEEIISKKKKEEIINNINNYLIKDKKFNVIMEISEKNGLSIFSIIFGIISILSCCIRYITLPLSIVGLVLGILSLVNKRGRKEFAILGIILSALALIFTLVVIIWGEALMSDALKNFKD